MRSVRACGRGPGSEPDLPMGPAFPSGRCFRICGWRCRRPAQLCTSWLRQRPSVERSLRTECAANGVQSVRSVESARARSAAYRNAGRAAPRRRGAVASDAISDDCAATRGRQAPSTSAVNASVGSQSSQDYFPSVLQGRSLARWVAPYVTWAGRACIHPRRQRLAAGRWRRSWLSCAPCTRAKRCPAMCTRRSVAADGARSPCTGPAGWFAGAGE